MRLPDFLIIGEMRCGTTTLWDCLRQHPGVYFPPEKELHYFASYRRFDHHGRHGRTPIDRYAAHFAPAGSDQICGEATPNYLFDPVACARIREALPDVRLVAILRDPIGRAWSHYWHQIRQLREHLGFVAALDAERTRTASKDPDDVDAFSYIARGRYIENLTRYADAFGAARLCVVFLEDMQRNGLRALQPAFHHLGLQASEAPDDYVLPSKNQAGYPKSSKLDAFCRIGRRCAEACGPLAAVPANAIASLTRPWRIYSGRPRMTRRIRARLAAEFDESDHALAEWLGRALPWRRDAFGDRNSRVFSIPHGIKADAPHDVCTRRRAG